MGHPVVDIGAIQDTDKSPNWHKVARIHTDWSKIIIDPDEGFKIVLHTAVVTHFNC